MQVLVARAILRRPWIKARHLAGTLRALRIAPMQDPEIAIACAALGLLERRGKEDEELCAFLQQQDITLHQFAVQHPLCPLLVFRLFLPVTDSDKLTKAHETKKGLVSLVPLLGSSGVCLIIMHDDSCSRPLVLAISTPPRKVELDFGTTHRFLRRGHHDKTA